MLSHLQHSRHKHIIWRWIILGVSLLGILIAGMYCVVRTANDYTVWIDIIGDKAITLEHGQTFVDPGAQGWRQGKLYHDEIVALVMPDIHMDIVMIL